MAAYNKFQSFVGELGKGTHQLHALGHTLKCMLTDELPLAADDTTADFVEIAAGNGYAAGGEDAQNDYSEAAGTGTLTCVDITWTAGPAAMAQFRYVVLYNSSAANKLVAWFDYGAEVNLNVGETFKTDFGASTCTIA